MTEERDGHHPCPDLEVWCAYADGSLPDTDREELEAHLGTCDRCFGIVSSLLISLGRDQAATAAVEEPDESGGPRAPDAEERVPLPAGPADLPATPAKPTPPELLARARALSGGRESRTRRWALYSAAAAVLVAVVSSLYVGQHYRGEPRSPAARLPGDSGITMEEESQEYAREARRSAGREAVAPGEPSLALGSSAPGRAAEDPAPPEVEISEVILAGAEVEAGMLAAAEGSAASGDPELEADPRNVSGTGRGVSPVRIETADVAPVPAGDAGETPAEPEPARGPGADLEGAQVYGALAGVGETFSRATGESTGQLSPVAAVPGPQVVRPAGGPLLKAAAPAAQGLAATEPSAGGRAGPAPDDGEGPRLAPRVETALEAGMEAARLQHAVAPGGDPEMIPARIVSLREKLAQLGPAPRTAAALRAMAAILQAPERDSGGAARGAPLMERRKESRAPQGRQWAQLQLLSHRLDGTLAADFPGAASVYLACGAWTQRVELTADPGRGGAARTDLDELVASGAELLAGLGRVGAEARMASIVAQLVEMLRDPTAPPDRRHVRDVLAPITGRDSPSR